MIPELLITPHTLGGERHYTAGQTWDLPRRIRVPLGFTLFTSFYHLNNNLNQPLDQTIIQNVRWHSQRPLWCRTHWEVEHRTFHLPLALKSRATVLHSLPTMRGHAYRSAKRQEWWAPYMGTRVSAMREEKAQSSTEPCLSTQRLPCATVKPRLSLGRVEAFLC